MPQEQREEACRQGILHLALRHHASHGKSSATVRSLALSPVQECDKLDLHGLNAVRLQQGVWLEQWRQLHIPFRRMQPKMKLCFKSNDR